MAAAHASISVTPAVWKSAHTEVGDCQYVDDGLDPVLLRALHDRVVYASSACCHHESALQEITIDVLSAVERGARRQGKGPRPLVLPKPRPFIIPKPKIVVLRGNLDEWRAIKAAATRIGMPLLDVVAEMFPMRKEGKSLIEVVDEMFPKS